jgi:CheY-like chemotaxis protein
VLVNSEPPAVPDTGSTAAGTRVAVGNVLIVEDDRATRDLVSTLLTAQGFYPICAEDGLEALHLLRAVRHRAPTVPCLILLDLAMPRFGGSAFRQAQLSDPVIAAVPVAVMSGAADAADRARALGAVATLSKPLDFEAVIDVVKRYCG